MKKWICTIIFLLGFTNLSAFANYQVFFGNTGRPATFSHGPCHRHSINNFGSNAAFAPHNTRGRRFVRDSFARPVSGRYSRPRPDYIYEHNHDYIMARTRNRRARMQRRYIISSSASKTPISRFDKNYQISTSTPAKSITCGGVTYYGSTNVCR